MVAMREWDLHAELTRTWGLTVQRAQELQHAGNGSRAWHVESAEGRFVAKLAFDRPSFVEPGLKVSSALAAEGLRTGAPRSTPDGRLAVGVPQPHGKEWTLALLAHVPGSRLQPSAAASERLAGSLLGTVHSILSRISQPSWVPGQLLEWSAEHARHTNNPAAARVVEEIAASSDSVTFSVVYGDPSPEIMVDATGIGLIDWGTPSWGPQLHDIAAWLRWLGETPGTNSPRESTFLAAYRERHRLSEVERNLLGVYGRYGAAFGF